MKTRLLINRRPLFLRVFFSAFCGVLLVISGCNNSINSSSNLGTAPGGDSSSTTPTSSSTPTSGSTFVITTIKPIDPPGSSSQSAPTVTTVTATPTPLSGVSTPPTINVYFSVSPSSTLTIANVCSVSNANGQGSTSQNPCICKFTWSELNPNSGRASPIVRTVTSAVTAVNAGGLSCLGPEVYYGEIPNGMQITLSILPGSGNSNSFTVSPHIFTKSTTVLTGSFQDTQGHLFDDILHYSCYNTFKRGKIQSKTNVQTNQSSGERRNVLFASQFCVAKSSGGSASGDECPTLTPASFSSQSYYFNLLIRNSEAGGINQSNNAFTCPTVSESLNSNNTLGTANQYWPMDATFALSLAPTDQFNVAVEANTKLSSTGDPTTAASSCFPGANAAAANGNSNSIITSCLGLAATPNPDGTCPSFTDSNGLVRQTYRLRRYVALYPRFFDSDGSALSGAAQPIDTLYILDRPVKAPTNVNANKPFTMLGPKPCPFAYFDASGVTVPYAHPTTSPVPIPSPYGYTGTNNSGWAYKNVDGIELPNVDSNGDPNAIPPTVPSCSAAIPVLNASHTKFLIHTLNAYVNGPITAQGYPQYSHAYIRPVQPFFPHYEEDTAFQACAPQASRFKDPPLHFVKDTNSGNVAWCAESYPSQNPNVSILDPAANGLVKTFTSHVVKNTSSNLCAPTYPTTLPTPYPSPAPTNQATANRGFARHNSITAWDSSNAALTCDRTVSLGSTPTWTGYPLLAPASDIEDATRGIHLDKSYWCSMTYDANGGKTHPPVPSTATNILTPSDGCCATTNVQVNPSTANRTAAHLEPDVPCGVPQY